MKDWVWEKKRKGKREIYIEEEIVNFTSFIIVICVEQINWIRILFEVVDFWLFHLLLLSKLKKESISTVHDDLC
jgi:hypothetical protein